MARLCAVVLSSCLVGSAAFLPPAVPLRQGEALQAVRGSTQAGTGRKVLQHYIKKLKEGGYPEKAAEAQFKDYSDRELDALFDLTVDQYDKLVDDAFNKIGPLKLDDDELVALIDDAFTASEGGEKASPLGIEPDNGGADDVLLMTGRAFEVVSNQLKNGGAIGDDGHKYLFLTPQELSNFNSDVEAIAKEIEAKFEEEMAPIDAKIAHWEKEFKKMEADPIKYTDALAAIPDGLEGEELIKAFPDYEPFNDTWKEGDV